MEKKTFDNGKSITVYGTAEMPYFKGSEVAKILGYKKPNNAVLMHVDDEDKIRAAELLSKFPQLNNLKVQKQTIFINKTGLESLVCRSRLPLSIDIAKSLGLNINTKITIKESDIIEKLIKVFSAANINYNLQYIVKSPENLYRIDCYLPDHKIALEIDENGHTDRNPTAEKARQKFIEKKLGCTFIRVNPDSKSFCIYKFIGEIFGTITE